MSKFLEKINRTTEILKRAGEKIGRVITDDPTRSQNKDFRLVPVQVENLNTFDVFVERDLRYDNYVMQWNRLLAPKHYVLLPGKKVILPNQYVTYTGKGLPKDAPLKLNMYFGSNMRD